MTDSEDLYAKSVNTDIFVPKDPESKPLTFGGNDATIPGLLYEVALYCTRMGLFQQLLQHHSAASGRFIMVDSLSSVPFVTGQIDDPRSMANPAPPGPERLAQVNARRAVAGLAAVHQYVWRGVNRVGGVNDWIGLIGSKSFFLN